MCPPPRFMVHRNHLLIYCNHLERPYTRLRNLWTTLISPSSFWWNQYPNGVQLQVCSQSQSALALITSSPYFKGYIHHHHRHHHHHHHHHCRHHHYQHHINLYHLLDNSIWKDIMSQYQLFTTLFCRSILLSQMAWFNPATSKGSLKVISTDLKSDIS